MENGIQALHIATGILVFLLAISIAVTSFSMATNTLQSIWKSRNLDEEFVTDANGDYLNYVAFSDAEREVDINTIISTMYRAYSEDIIIYFYKNNGDTFTLYKGTNTKGELDDVNYIDLKTESDKGFIKTTPQEHLNNILKSKSIYADGLYQELSKFKFTEKLGEYYINGDTDIAEVNKIKKRVIAYIAN